MTITHHADDATLMSYAAGTLPEALSAVVASHLSLCPHCRAEAALMDEVGAVLIANVKPEPFAMPAPRTPACIDKRVDEGDHVLDAIERSGNMPAPLSRLAGSDIGSTAWKRLGYGVWHLPLPLSKGSKGDLRLIKVAPGQAMPEHGHGGSELSLILAGSYRDSIGRFGPGDLADLDSDVEHRPIADAKTGCICVIASEEPARFKGLLARLVQPFVGI